MSTSILSSKINEAVELNLKNISNTEAMSTISYNSELHSCVLKNDVESVIMLLKNGSDPNAVDQLGRTPLHCAAIVLSNQILEILLQNGANPNAKIQDTFNSLERKDLKFFNETNVGRTALHIAVAKLNYNCTKVLLQKQANVNAVDEKGLTPLLTIGESIREGSQKQNYKNQYENLMNLLLEWKANINFFSIENGIGALHGSVEFDSLNSFKRLLKEGANPSNTDCNGDTILHFICRRGNEKFTNEILLTHRNLVNLKNKHGETPLHCAAHAGFRQCLTILINNGGDLSQMNNSKLTVCDLIFSSIPRPLNFLVKTLDSKLIPNEYSINDKNFTVTLDFEVLIPNSEQQTSVLIALINSLPYEQKSKIVLHPFIASFIKLKWARLRIIFFSLVIIHLMFVTSLSLHICFLIKGQSMFVYNWSRFVLLFTSAILLIHILTQISLAYKYFLKEFETWLTLICVSLSLTIGIWETFFMKEPLPPLWIRHLAAYNILLSWILLMFMLGRFPLMGYVALMFFTVLKNVLKVLLFFTCLVIGFSLSFCVQFNDMQFDDPWKAFVRTTIMLMGEYEYGELFNDNKIMKRFQDEAGNLFVTSRIIFLLFVLLGSIVLVNLLTGLAVSDIQALRAEGCLRHMIKQAEFISHVEKISKKKLNQKLIPKYIIKLLNKTQSLPKSIIIQPNINEKMREANQKKKLKDIPPKLIELIMLHAIKNQQKNLKNQSEAIILKDGFDNFTNHRNQWVDTHIHDALNDIKHELQELSLCIRQKKTFLKN